MDRPNILFVEKHERDDHREEEPADDRKTGREPQLLFLFRRSQPLHFNPPAKRLKYIQRMIL